MSKNLCFVALLMTACSEPAQSVDGQGVIECTEGCGSGGGDGGNPAQTCEDNARSTCSSIGYGGNAYCYLVFAQDCSVGDASAARVYCGLHPEIVHGTNPDGSCRLIWR